MALLAGSACTRTLPDPPHLPPADPAELRVQGLSRQQVWEQVLGREDAAREEILRLSRWMAAEQRITGNPLVAGNRAQLLVDGPMTFDAIFAALRQARHHIHLETFIISDDAVGRELARILKERRRDGVQVRLIVDAFGALDASESYLERLRESGIEVFKYHPIDPTEDVRIWRINTRHHRKLLVVDGRVGFLGGINISSVYASSSFSEPNRPKGPDEAWRDTHVRVEGPIVAELQSLFVNLWARLHASAPLRGQDYFPEEPRKGRNLMRLASDLAYAEKYKVYRLYLAAIDSAAKSIWITQGYFSPDRQFLEALRNASRRGVDVRLLLPGVTDSWITISSSRSHYDALLKEGVRIFERRDALQHAKTAVIDGLWSIVGSSNLDHRSFLHSNEANLVIWGVGFGEEMQALFLDDQALNTEIVLEQWRQRPFTRHLLERLANLFAYWL